VEDLMSIPDDGPIAQAKINDSSVRRHCSWLFSYEIYAIIIIAAFLRLYGINTTEFDADQADIFHLAYNAISHVHLVATSNLASIGVYNPPGIIYALMIPAAFSANPIGGAIETAFLAVIGVFLTYWYTRRYYGRVAATIASSLFAVTSVPLFYSRFMWNQNLLLFFVPLFVIVLFRGVVDRRPGWLFPALFLYGLMIQLHESSVLLAAPLVAAIFLAPKTVRWRDIVLGMLSLFVLYAPYMLWLISTHFAALSLVSKVGTIHSFIDNQSWLFYLHFISPYDLPFKNRLTLLYDWQNFFNWLLPVMAFLIIAAALFALLLVLFLGTTRTGPNISHVLHAWWRNIRALRAAPYRCGLLVTLIWQAFPLLVLIKHALLYPHYFIILMPGPFILIGLLIAKVAGWLHNHRRWFRFASIAIYVFASLLILFQGFAGIASVLDTMRGNFDDHLLSYPYYTDLDSLQNALIKADQLSQKYHAGRIIIAADRSTRSAFRYLSEQLHTSASVVDDSCLLLPGSTASSAVVLVPPYEKMLDAFFSSGFMHVHTSYTSTRLGGEPFHLYVVDHLPQTATQETLSSNLQFVSAQMQSLQNKSWVIMRWNLLQPAPASDFTSYSYRFRGMDNVKGSTQAQQVCTSTSTQAGDQLIAFLPQTSNRHSLRVQAERSSTTPYAIKTKLFGVFPIAFDTFQQDSTPWISLKTVAGASMITILIKE
jgi:4-amino-4-deoxy-L-arabinose transferase-like glycosyltransferase